MTFVADEEYASAGLKPSLVSIRPDAAIVCEPTGLSVRHHKVCLARGIGQGVAAHGSLPEEALTP